MSIRGTGIGWSVWAAALCAGCTTAGTEGHEAMKDIQTGFVPVRLTVGATRIAHSVYVPPDYDPSRKWPLILFLHGMGERGDDGVVQTEVGIGKALREHPDRFPCIVAMPQCPKDSTWNTRGDIVDAALDHAIKHYAIDPDRVYLTGLSMGGFGTWIHGASRTDVFAAFIPICGGGNASDAPALAKRPVWAFHGANDSVVNPQVSRTMVEAVTAAGGTVKYTEYEGVDHNSWDATYGDPAVIAWLLEQRR